MNHRDCKRIITFALDTRDMTADATPDHLCRLVSVSHQIRLLNEHDRAYGLAAKGMAKRAKQFGIASTIAEDLGARLDAHFDPRGWPLTLVFTSGRQIVRVGIPGL